MPINYELLTDYLTICAGVIGAGMCVVVIVELLVYGAISALRFIKV